MNEKRLEEIERAIKVMKEYFDKPNFKLTSFNYDVVIADMEYLIEQNKRCREVIEQVKDNIPLQFNHGSEYEAKKNVLRLININNVVDEALEGSE